MATTCSIRVLPRVLHHFPRRKQLLQCLHRRSVASYTGRHQAAQLSVIPTAVDTTSEKFQENAAAMRHLTDKIARLHAEVARGGPEKARQKHIERGKMLVRDRITALIDPESSFLELSALAGHELYEGEEVPAGGLVTGIGSVEGVMCMVVANDSTYVSSFSAAHSPRPILSRSICCGEVLTCQECKRRNLLPNHRPKALTRTSDCT